MISCAHPEIVKFGKNRNGTARFRCKVCGKTFTEPQEKPLGGMTVSIADAKLALRMLVEGNSIRTTSRITGLNRNTIAKLIVNFGRACRTFMDRRMRGLKLSHLQFDEQWTYVAKKQARLTIDERKYAHDLGDIYIWTCIDQKTKLLPSFLIGKRSADNARRFMLDIAKRLVFPTAHDTDSHAFAAGSYTPIVQISSDAFAGYREAVDLAFGPYVRYGTIMKEYRNAKIIYTPSEIVGTVRKGIRGIDRREERTICTSHVERLNGTQRLFLKRLNRLTVCFSKKLASLEAAFSMFAAWYNYCWQTRTKGTSGKLRPTAAMMAGIAGHVWNFDELFAAALNPSTQE
jgi:transposase-like protein/IS1 family transposase